MARPGIESKGWDLRWDAEDLSESYEELGELERFAEAPQEDATPESGLELAATLEAREDEGFAGDASRTGAEEPAPETAPADLETYAVRPDLDLLVGILEAINAEAPPEKAAGDSASSATYVG